MPYFVNTQPDLHAARVDRNVVLASTRDEPSKTCKVER